MIVLEDNMAIFEALGATLISIVSDFYFAEMLKKLGVVGKILIDKLGEIAKCFKLNFQFSQEVEELFLRLKINCEKK